MKKYIGYAFPIFLLLIFLIIPFFVFFDEVYLNKYYIGLGVYYVFYTTILSPLMILYNTVAIIISSNKLYRYYLFIGIGWGLICIILFNVKSIRQELIQIFS
jgi:hypothetical protein